jgi:hypothetical protein
MMGEKKCEKRNIERKRHRLLVSTLSKADSQKKISPDWPVIFQKISASSLHVVAAPPKN